MNFQEQSEIYIDRLMRRKRNPVKPATLAVYKSYLTNWILPKVGSLPLGKVENGTMRSLVAYLTEAGLSASTIAGIQNTVKEVVSSCIDKNGNELHPRVWNSGFIDAPEIDQRTQKAPSISQLEANTAILAAPSLYSTLFLLAAGSGLRIGEILALKARPEPGKSHFDPYRGCLVIKTALYRNREQAPKTAAGVREVDLYPALSDRLLAACPSTGYLFTGSDKPLRRQTAYDALSIAGIPGYHSFRRFRATHLETNNVPDSMMKFWLGHANDDITDRYIKIGQEVQARKEWAEKVGIGVDIP